MRLAGPAGALVLLIAGALSACGSTDERAVAAAPDASSIRGPRDLPYYDVAWAKALTLEAMNARVVSRESVDGLDILSVQYDAFDQPIAASDGARVIRWRQRGALILPPAPLLRGKALAVNVHNDDAGSAEAPRSYVRRAMAVAQAFRIPVLVHGWLPDVLEPIDGRSVHATQDLVMQRLLAAGIESAGDLPMDGSYLFNGNPLAKADMVSLTLLQRLVQQERGSPVEEVAALGISKEGAAHWILGAVDDRVAVLGTGGYYVHDSRETYERYGKDTGWRLPWKGAERPEYDGVRSLFNTFWRFCDWVNETEAGQLVARTTMDPARWYDDIRARHVVVFGDLGIMPTQHDGPWPFWAEVKPLHSLHHPSWRYVRVFGGSGVYMDEQGIDDMGLSMLPHLADLLVNDATLPATPRVDIDQVGDRQVRVRAQAAVSPDLPREALVLYGTSTGHSFRDPEDWHTATMRETATGSWELELPVVPNGQELALMVVVRERVTRGPLQYWRSASSLPIEQFPLPEYDLPGPRWKN